MTSSEILQTLKRIKPMLETRFDVEQIGLFGSVARNEVNDASDIDVLVKLKDPSFLKLAGLLNYLESVFHKKVDITTDHKYLSPRFTKAIQRDLIYA